LVPTQSDIDSASILDETCRKEIQEAGTLEKLVDHLLSSLLLGNILFVPTFLSSYQRFTTTQHVLMVNTTSVSRGIRTSWL
jgi:hypothetical protein